MNPALIISLKKKFVVGETYARRGDFDRHLPVTGMQFSRYETLVT